jgi:hypothetical protein
MIEILEIENEKVVPNIHCHSIPELQAVLRKYKNPIPALSYLYYMCHPRSPYSNLEEYQKEETILFDFPGDYTPEDSEIIEARKKLEKLYETPTKRFYFNVKKGLDTLGEYLGTTEITAGQHGNFAPFNVAMTRVGTIMADFKKLEKMYEEETQSTIRGGHEKSFDE